MPFFGDFRHKLDFIGEGVLKFDAILLYRDFRRKGHLFKGNGSKEHNKFRFIGKKGKCRGKEKKGGYCVGEKARKEAR